MFARFSTFLFSCVAFAANAQDVTPFVGAHGAITPGTYIGEVDGSTTQLDLWPDQSFHYKADDLAYAGKWHADPKRDGIVLDLGNETVVLEVRNAQRLRPEGAPEDGAQDLETLETFSAAALALPVSGMFTYFADAALFVHCATGRTYPVALEGDYLALERA